MKIALIKETKVPEDNRMALSPVQVAELNVRKDMRIHISIKPGDRVGRTGLLFFGQYLCLGCGSLS